MLEVGCRLLVVGRLILLSVACGLSVCIGWCSFVVVVC